MNYFAKRSTSYPTISLYRAAILVRQAPVIILQAYFALAPQQHPLLLALSPSRASRMEFAACWDWPPMRPDLTPLFYSMHISM